MAAHNQYQLKALLGGYVVVPGSFAPNAGSAIVATSNKGKGWTVARTSAGLFTITFDAKYVDLIYFDAGLQLAVGDDKYCQPGTYTAASKTMTVRVWDISGAAETDVAANANNRINFLAVFDNSSRKPTRG